MVKKYDFSWDSEKAKEKNIPFNQELYEKKLKDWIHIDWYKYLIDNMVIPFKAKRVTPWEELNFMDEFQEFENSDNDYQEENFMEANEYDRPAKNKVRFDTESFAEEELEDGFHEIDPFSQSDDLEEDDLFGNYADNDEFSYEENYDLDDEDFDNYIDTKSKKNSDLRNQQLADNDTDPFDYGKEMDVVEIIKNKLNQSILAKVKIKNKSNYIPLFEIEPQKDTDSNYWILREYHKAVNFYGSDLDEIQPGNIKLEDDIAFSPLKKRIAGAEEKILIIKSTELIENEDSKIEGVDRFIYIPEQMNIIEFAQSLAEAFEIEFDNEFIYCNNIKEWENSNQKFESDQDKIKDIKLDQVFTKKGMKWIVILGFERDQKFLVKLENLTRPSKKQKYPLISEEEEL